MPPPGLSGAAMNTVGSILAWFCIIPLWSCGAGDDNAKAKDKVPINGWYEATIVWEETGCGGRSLPTQGEGVSARLFESGSWVSLFVEPFLVEGAAQANFKKISATKLENIEVHTGSQDIASDIHNELTRESEFDRRWTGFLQASARNKGEAPYCTDRASLTLTWQRPLD